jgi:hypothetical protein
MKQQRLLATAPRPVTEDDIAAIFERRRFHGPSLPVEGEARVRSVAR